MLEKGEKVGLEILFTHGLGDLELELYEKNDLSDLANRFLAESVSATDNEK